MMWSGGQRARGSARGGPQRCEQAAARRYSLRWRTCRLRQRLKCGLIADLKKLAKKLVDGRIIHACL